MQIIKLLCLMTFFGLSFADTIGQYMTVANNISRMEMKADAEAQAWVRSARNVLLLSAESIWESLNIANENAHHQLFCIPKTYSMTAESMTDLIKDSYQHLNISETEKNQFTVAKIALLGLQQKYPCGPSVAQPSVTLQHHGQSPVQKMVHMGKMAGLM
jgi:PIN domain nuclease of toxin-antitoxin system